MRHLTPADYRPMPWANGRGATIEMLREEGPDGLRLRLSMASVVEDGPFSLFPGIERSLTVISGPGFRLEGAVSMDCRPLEPVAFPGDVAVRADGTRGMPSEDFNVMTARALPRPDVRVVRGGGMIGGGGTLYMLALDSLRVNGVPLGKRDLVILTDPARIEGDGAMVVVRLAQS